ncbi:MAG: acetyl-coenzyme A synthetase N-terminal domain-containing protein, partial [Alphaproteobacteria bacterium]
MPAIIGEIATPCRALRRRKAASKIGRDAAHFGNGANGTKTGAPLRGRNSGTMTSRYDEIYRRSIEDPNGFWGEAAEAIHWTKKWDRV